MTRIGQLFDTIIEQHGLRNDAALAVRLDIEPGNLSRLRHNLKSPGSGLILRIHDAFDMPIAEIKRALGIPALPLAPACRVPTRAEALAQYVVQKFAPGILSQRKAAEGIGGA